MFLSSAFAQTVETPVKHAGEAAQHAKGVFPPFDFSYYESHIFWLIICFGLFYIIISRIIVPRIGGTIEIRRDRIASDHDKAERMNMERESAIASYERELSEARSRAIAIAQSSADEIRGKIDEERKKSEAELDKKLAESEERIKKIRDGAMGNVNKIAETTAAEIVEQLIGTKVSASQATAAVKSVSGVE
ncbi:MULTISPECIES: F0F1 ATP synthase subunit B [Bartonella]|uniref:F0F1 ATP synthase subunit B n=1 Tax=Bartonella TaxID=773 RepID=UPI0018DD54DD|nr:MULTISPECIES: F0F1 ATP synthase subunit B [Bartonella]MBH9974191.1 F0F1 ATP synthase subunit B [Bartonella choladocola]MBI0013798.1 F0F1 ATP synthase subunit B [Bartonella sp. B10834G3]